MNSCFNSPVSTLLRWCLPAFGSLIPLAAANSSFADESHFRFITGLTYVSNLHDLADKIEANHPVNVDVLWPVGLSLRGEYEMKSGLAVGLSVGPGLIVFGDVGFHVIPVGADVTYSFPGQNSVRPFVRVGVQQPLVGGDYVNGGSAGITGGIGCEFGRNRKLGWGLELGYSGAKVGVTTSRGGTIDAQPYGVTGTMFLRF